MRLSVLEVCKGRERIELYPPDRMIVLPRIKFRGQSTDKVTCAWMIWKQPGSELASTVRCLPKFPKQEGVAA